TLDVLEALGVHAVGDELFLVAEVVGRLLPVGLGRLAAGPFSEEGAERCDPFVPFVLLVGLVGRGGGGCGAGRAGGAGTVRATRGTGGGGDGDGDGRGGQQQIASHSRHDAETTVRKL